MPQQTGRPNERWNGVDQYAESHLLDPSTKLSKDLARTLELSDEADLDTPIAVSPLQGKFLALQCRLQKVKNVLEIGTLGGYSSLWMASATPETTVTTLEIDPAAHASAQRAHKDAGMSDRIECILGAALETLPTIRSEVDSGKRPKFGFVFIDADKVNNLNYVNAAIPMCLPGACIIIDNIARRGRLGLSVERLKADGVTDDQIGSVKGAMEVVEAVGKDERFDCTLLQTVGEKGYDGFLMCVLK